MKATFPEQDPKARVVLALEDICPEGECVGDEPEREEESEQC